MVRDRASRVAAVWCWWCFVCPSCSCLVASCYHCLRLFFLSFFLSTRYWMALALRWGRLWDHEILRNDSISSDEDDDVVHNWLVS